MEYSIGDWVVAEDGRFDKGHLWNTPFQITKLIPVSVRSDDFYCYNEKGNNNYLSNFRHCLPHEIPGYEPPVETCNYLDKLLSKWNIK